MPESARASTSPASGRGEVDPGTPRPRPTARGPARARRRPRPSGPRRRRPWRTPRAGDVARREPQPRHGQVQRSPVGGGLGLDARHPARGPRRSARAAPSTARCPRRAAPPSPRRRGRSAGAASRSRLSWSRSSRFSHSAWSAVRSPSRAAAARPAKKSAARSAERSRLAGLLQPGGGVLPDRLEHPVARSSSSGRPATARPARDNAGTTSAPSPATCCGGVQGEAAGEDRQPAQAALLLGGEQVVAPVERRAHGALAGGQVAAQRRS